MMLAKRTNPSSALRRVTIVGGTHGNERAGLHLVQHFEQHPHLVARPSFETRCVLSNTAAIKANRRYVDTDLNRCFNAAALDTARAADPASRNTEQIRALELDALLGPKFSENPATDLVLDLHNTTSDTGVLLCFHSQDAFACEIAAYLRQFDADVFASEWSAEDPPFLPTIGRSGMTVEVGPVAHSTVSAAILQRTKQLLVRVLDYVQLHNEQQQADNAALPCTHVAVELPVAHIVAKVDYPRDANGELAAFVHPSLQGVPELRGERGRIQCGAPIFQTVGGESLMLRAEDFPTGVLDPAEEYYPMFVNEAAYYEKGVAFYLTRVLNKSVDVLERKVT